MALHRKTLIAFFSASMILLLFASCNKPVEPGELPGYYVWSDGRFDTLEVRSDGTYEYTTFGPGQRIARSGKWNYHRNTSEVEFEREYFPFLKDHVSEGSWFSRAKKSNSEIQLLYAVDDKKYLKKVRKPGR